MFLLELILLIKDLKIHLPRGNDSQDLPRFLIPMYYIYESLDSAFLLKADVGVWIRGGGGGGDVDC